jgi:hypothetical protein
MPSAIALEPGWVHLETFLEFTPLTMRDNVKQELIEEFISGKRPYRCVEFVGFPYKDCERAEAYDKDPLSFYNSIGDTFIKLPEDYWRLGLVSDSSLLFANRTFFIFVWVGEPAEQSTIKLFQTGSAGRPSAKGIIIGEFRRRITAGEVATYQHGGLTAESVSLFQWWETEGQTHIPPGPEVTSKTIENQIRPIWRELKRKAKPTK